MGQLISVVDRLPSGTAPGQGDLGIRSFHRPGRCRIAVPSSHPGCAASPCTLPPRFRSWARDIVECMLAFAAGFSSLSITKDLSIFTLFTARRFPTATPKSVGTGAIPDRTDQIPLWNGDESLRPSRLRQVVADHAGAECTSGGYTVHGARHTGHFSPIPAPLVHGMKIAF